MKYLQVIWEQYPEEIYVYLVPHTPNNDSLIQTILLANCQYIEAGDSSADEFLMRAFESYSKTERQSIEEVLASTPGIIKDDLLNPLPKSVEITQICLLSRCT